MKTKAIVAEVNPAFRELFERDGELFELGTDGISEQTLTFRLGLYMQQRFPEHHVDCEYNRYLDKKKHDPHVDQKWIQPDLIVHRRNNLAQNLIVIEAKKKRRWSAGFDRVHQKLSALTRRPGKYEYRLGLAWKIADASDPAKHAAIWYAQGKEVLRTNLIDFTRVLALVEQFAESAKIETAIRSNLKELGYGA